MAQALAQALPWPPLSLRRLRLAHMNIFGFALCSAAAGRQDGGEDDEGEATSVELAQPRPPRAQSADVGPPTLLTSGSGLPAKANSGPILVRGGAPVGAPLSRRGGSWGCGAGCQDGSPGNSPQAADVVEEQEPERPSESDGIAEVLERAVPDASGVAGAACGPGQAAAGAAIDREAEEDRAAMLRRGASCEDVAKLRHLLADELKLARAKMEEGDLRHRELEEQLAAARRRAEVEADKRRTLEEKIAAEHLRKEEAVAARELGRMRAEEEARRAYDKAVATAHSRLQEEKRAEEEGAAAKRAEEEVASAERWRLEDEALRRSADAREQREIKEKVKLFLAEHGYRHVRARCSRRTFSRTYALHCAVYRNDAEMVRLLLQIGADGAAKNTWGQTPHRYAQWLSRRGSHEAVLGLLGTPGAAPS